MRDFAQNIGTRLKRMRGRLPRLNRRQASPENSRRLGRHFLTIGKFALLAGILIAVGLFSAVVGMKIAVRRTEVSAPDVIGESYQEAKASIERAHLTAAILARRYDPEAPLDAIVSQSPAAGGRLKQGHKVRLVVSLGPRKQPVPQLVGNDLRFARARLMQTDYVLGSVSEMVLDSAEDGTVIRQYPPAGTEERGGVKIDLLVARKVPPRYVMPDIVGESLSRVFRLLEGNGIRIGQIQYRDDRRSRRGTVLRQYPEPGYMLKATDQVNVEVAG